MKILITIGTIVFVLIIGFYINAKFISVKKTPPTSPSPSISISPDTKPSISPINDSLALPIADFKNRITKKTFGMYITPENSSVQPERFSGYHNAVDIEYTDITSDVPVFAINDGIIIYSGLVSGYGGVLILKSDINGGAHSVLYGHLRPSSLPAVGIQFKKGNQMAFLGTGYSTETDGERRHLHFAVLSDDRIDHKGYVSSQSELSGWLEPLSLY